MKVYPHIYSALKFAGHSPAKALEIILDARRGTEHAKRWCRICARSYRAHRDLRKLGVLRFSQT